MPDPTAEVRRLEARVSELEGLEREHIRSEEALRKAVQQWHATFDAVTDAVCLLDVEGRVQRCNQAMLTLMGRGNDDLTGSACWEVMHGAAGPIDECPVVRMLKSGKRETLELSFKGRHFFVTADPLRDERGQLVGAVHLMRDITDRKEAERERDRLREQTVETQKLESLAVLAGGVAHDFNNILMGLLGYAELALEAMPPMSSARADIVQIKHLANRAAALAKQMLAYSGRGHFVVEPIALDELVAGMSSLLESSCARRAVLEFDFESETHAIMADAAQVRQIVMNLVVNAHEASEETGGPIAVRTRVIDCDSTYLSTSRLPEKPDEGAYICLEVSDTGDGMDEDSQARMFDPFFTTKFTGRGLGLSAVLGIVRGHGGAIMVDSAPEDGTTVRVLFPAHKPAVDQDREDERVGPAGHVAAGTILLVDDEEPVRRAAKRMLENRGLRVITAADGREAADAFKERVDEVDCVLLDLSMPRVGGQETYRLLREVSSDVCVILSSGYSEDDALRRFDTDGLAGFIQKPYTAEKLMAMLRQVLPSSAT